MNEPTGDAGEDVVPRSDGRRADSPWDPPPTYEPTASGALQALRALGTDVHFLAELAGRQIPGAMPRLVRARHRQRQGAELYRQGDYPGVLDLCVPAAQQAPRAISDRRSRHSSSGTVDAEWIPVPASPRRARSTASSARFPGGSSQVRQP